MLLLFSLLCSACTGPATSTEQAKEVATEGVSTEVEQESLKSDASVVEEAPEPVIEKAEPLAWSTTTLEKTLPAGAVHRIPLPETTGGEGKISFFLKTKNTIDGLSIDGKELVIRFSYNASVQESFEVIAEDEKKQSASLSVKINTTIPEWTKLSFLDGPTGRANPAMALAGDRLLMLGGFVAAGGSSELWMYQLSKKSWTLAKASGDVIPEGGVFRWVVTSIEEDGNKVEGLVVQGMSSSQAPITGTYRFVINGTDVSWTKLQEEGTVPTPRAISAIGYSSKKKMLVLFGGITLSGKPDNITYTMKLNGDKAVWETPTLQFKPPARYGSQFGVDPVHGRLYVVSGTAENQGPLTDTWVLHMDREEGMLWQEIKAKTPILWRQNGALFVDVMHRRLLIWGGANGTVAFGDLDALCLDDKEPTWEKVGNITNPPTRTSIYSACNPTTGKCYTGGGRTPTLLNDLWSLDTAPTPKSAP